MLDRRRVLLERLAAANRFAERVRKFADRPKDRMDAFSQILSGVQLTGAVFFSAEFPAPWGLFDVRGESDGRVALARARRFSLKPSDVRENAHSPTMGSAQN